MRKSHESYFTKTEESCTSVIIKCLFSSYWHTINSISLEYKFKTGQTFGSLLRRFWSGEKRSSAKYPIIKDIDKRKRKKRNWPYMRRKEFKELTAKTVCPFLLHIPTYTWTGSRRHGYSLVHIPHQFDYHPLW